MSFPPFQANNQPNQSLQGGAAGSGNPLFGGAKLFGGLGGATNSTQGVGNPSEASQQPSSMFGNPNPLLGNKSLAGGPPEPKKDQGPSQTLFGSGLGGLSKQMTFDAPDSKKEAPSSMFGNLQKSSTTAFKAEVQKQEQFSIGGLQQSPFKQSATMQTSTMFPAPSNPIGGSMFGKSSTVIGQSQGNTGSQGQQQQPSILKDSQKQQQPNALGNLGDGANLTTSSKLNQEQKQQINTSSKLGGPQQQQQQQKQKEEEKKQKISEAVPAKFPPQIPDAALVDLLVMKWYDQVKLNEEEFQKAQINLCGYELSLHKSIDQIGLMHQSSIAMLGLYDKSKSDLTTIESDQTKLEFDLINLDNELEEVIQSTDLKYLNKVFDLPSPSQEQQKEEAKQEAPPPLQKISKTMPVQKSKLFEDKKQELKSFPARVLLQIDELEQEEATLCSEIQRIQDQIDRQQAYNQKSLDKIYWQPMDYNRRDQNSAESQQETCTLISEALKLLEEEFAKLNQQIYEKQSQMGELKSS